MNSVVLLQQNMLIIYHLYLGGMFMLFVFNLFLFLRLKEIMYAYYTGHVLSWGVFIYFYSGLDIYLDLSEVHYKLHFSACLSVFFFILFTKYFLNIQRYNIYYFKLLDYLSYLFIFFTILNIYSTEYFQVYILFSLIVYIILMFISIQIALKGSKGAKLYFIAMVINMFCLVSLSALLYGWIENNDFIRYSFLAGSFFEIVFFTLLLSDRFNKLQKEKLKAQNEILDYKRQNEQELEAQVEIETVKIEKLLKEKDVLLKEVYHRVKNNFQLLIGLLWIEGSEVSNKTLKESISSLINRLKSMTIVHELLYDSKNILNIHLKEYISKVTKEIVNSYSDTSIQIDEEIDDIILKTDDALTLGMILNEILNNSIKHSKKDICKITIRVNKNQNKIFLEVRDNGEGFDDQNIEDSFGLNIIKDFSKKLKNSKLTFESKKTERVLLEFDSN